ncbi:MAG: hypothetical protein GYB67_04910 [Chloroflexi bacterium]|nr:hypothetical protein [Chloroflexota bacterium]
MTTSIGTYRHLAQCSTPSGHFAILAVDHRGNLRQQLEKHAASAGAGQVTERTMTAFKQEVTNYLAPYASAVLTDPDYGFGPGIAEGTIGGKLGLLAPLEITDYGVHPSLRALNMIPGWTVGKIKRAGGSGV